MTALGSNAKKGSIREDVAKHLQSHYDPPSSERNLVVNKSKNHVNPYLDVWAWSNQNVEWAGPEKNTVQVKQSHAILPILYHHFGCVCPSYEALCYISQLSKGRKIVDMGSGNGYWTYMLRRLEQGKKKSEVMPVDSGLSEYRTIWVDDTVQLDGVKWLNQHQGAKDAVLLLVYPNTGEDFTSKMIKAYRTYIDFDIMSSYHIGDHHNKADILCLAGGTTIIAASSQNASGFTAFAKETIADWMSREMSEWEKVLQIPLPSFAGKDEALFVFEKKGSSGS